MPIIHPSIFEIIQRFPEQRENILGLYGNSYSFRTMCEDLRKCKDAHQHWSQSESKDAKTRSEEYRELLESLELEISQCIERNCPGYTNNNKTGN